MQKQQACSFNRTFHWRVYRYYDLYRHQIIYFVVSGPHYPVVRQVKKCQMFKGKPKNQRPWPLCISAGLKTYHCDICRIIFFCKNEVTGISKHKARGVNHNVESGFYLKNLPSPIPGKIKCMVIICLVRRVLWLKYCRLSSMSNY